MGKLPSSYRDPSGFVFSHDGAIYRQVNSSYREHYDLFMQSGLYHELQKRGLLVSHTEVAIRSPQPSTLYKILKPERIPFVSYPYEWCFSELKDAALLTLEIQKTALRSSMSLKDASAFNVQFIGTRPVFIDTLSFERYREGKPWVAYRQFCEQFLGPLVLMSKRDARLGQLLRVFPDGIPVDLVSTLLPLKTWMAPSLLAHIHLHAKSQRRFSTTAASTPHRSIDKPILERLIATLQSTVKGLSWEPQKTTWTSYYELTNYTDRGMEHKKKVVESFMNKLSPKTVWDLGANTGTFSDIAASKKISTIAFDNDICTVELLFRRCTERKDANTLPLILDLTNPSPPVGFANRERMTLEERGPADMVLALALVHHLAIGKNVPLSSLASYFSRIGKSLIIEFVPKSDSQVQAMLSNRDDIFDDYDEESFKREFSRHFTIRSSEQVADSSRIIYLMVRKHTA
ncbi:MAG: SAM-dependent methyltransferase [Candidatus Kerfeldbacteria bacterium]